VREREGEGGEEGRDYSSFFLSYARFIPRVTPRNVFNLDFQEISATCPRRLARIAKRCAVGASGIVVPRGLIITDGIYH